MLYHWELEYRDGTELTEPPEGLWDIDHTNVHQFIWVGEDGRRIIVNVPPGAFLLERKSVFDGKWSFCAAGYRIHGQDFVLHIFEGAVELNNDYLMPF